MTRFVRKSVIATALAAVFGISGAFAAPPAKPMQPAAKAAAPVSLDKNKVSTMVGMDIGRGLSQIKDDIDLDVVFKALKQTVNGEKTSLTPEEALEVRKAFMQQMQAKRVAERKVEAEKNKTEGAAFLAKNKKKTGVKTTASGLQYEVIKQGTGPKPKPTDTVKVNYKGTKVDGTEFDSSYKRGQPATFPLNGVIKGWSEGLELMPVGSEYRFFIPADLAYGENGPGPIGPNATLIFDVQLLGIENNANKGKTAPMGKKPMIKPIKKKSGSK
ncbi:MAG: FKBP-type peptidyl-prolyl cis-trans isomerase [Rhodanobacteraceae bacterium]